MKTNPRITNLCTEIVPVAADVFYRPKFNKQKNKDVVIKMKDLVTKKEATDIKLAIAKKNVSLSLELLTELREKLEEKERRLTNKPSKQRRK